jgi:hypothetical protein
VLLPLGGLLLAMCMHAAWNASSSLGDYGFLAVYGVLMAPVFGLLTWLVVFTRQRELRTVREELPAYAVAGWLVPSEPFALGSMRARRLARDFAAHHLGRPAAREVARYEAGATSLALLRRRGRGGHAGPDFAERERELLHEMWRRREVARPALVHAARVTAPPVPVLLPPLPLPWTPYGGTGPWPPREPAGAPVPQPAYHPYAHPYGFAHAHPYPYTPPSPYP